MRTYRRLRWSLAFASLVIGTFLVLTLDANQPSSAGGPPIALLDRFNEIDFSAHGSQTTSGIGTVHYDMEALAGSGLMMESKSTDRASRSDIVVLVPTALIASTDSAQFSGDTEAANDFQELDPTAVAVPEPRALLLISVGLVSLGMWRPRRS